MKFSFTPDAYDRHLLEALRTNADQTNRALAEAVGLSPASTLRRVRRLRAAGFIERQVAILHPEALGPQLQVVVEVTLERQGQALLDRFVQWAHAQGAIRQCHQVSPGPDFVLMVEVPDMAAYHRWSQALLQADTNVRNAKAYFSVAQHIRR